jgi:CDGSH-type Zn-finger protein
MSDEKPVIADKSPCIQEMEPGEYWWCSCGKSKKQPFCDGSHEGTGFTPTKVELTTKKKVAWCNCKHSKRGYLCDGAHSKLP